MASTNLNQKNSRSPILPEQLPGSQFIDTKILLDDAITLSNDDFLTTVASCQIFRDTPPVSGPRIIISRNISTQPTNSTHKRLVNHHPDIHKLP